MSKQVSKPKVRARSETSSSVYSNRLSFGGSIRLNDLLNDEDEYGFAEEATEMTLREYEVDSRACTHPIQMVTEETPMVSSCPSALSSPLQQRLHEESTSHLRIGSRDAQDDASSAERASIGSASVASNESSEKSEGKDKKSGLSALIVKAKKKIGGSKERLKRDKGDKKQSHSHEVATETSDALLTVNELESSNEVNESLQEEVVELSRRPSSLSLSASPPSPLSLPPILLLTIHHTRLLPFPQTRLAVAAVLTLLTAISQGFLTGLLWGLYLSFSIFLFFFVSDPQRRNCSSARDSPREDGDNTARTLEVEEAIEAKEDAFVVSSRVTVVYKGWMNELPFPVKYEPSSYHVNSCRCVLIRLEGSTLRISRPSRAMLKHAFHSDPSLTASRPSMLSQSIYDLSGATVCLRPRRLARRRWWSRKYPIFIRFAPDERPHTVRKRPSTIKRSVSMQQGRVSVEEREVREDREESKGFESDTESSDTTEDDEYVPLSMTELPRTRSNQDMSQSTTSLRELAKKKGGKTRQKGIYLFARAAREKERWFHLLREACARARCAGIVEEEKIAKDTATDKGSAPLTPMEKKRRMSMNIDAQPSSSVLSSGREFMLYRSNQAHFTKVMSEAIGVSIASLTTFSSSTTNPSLSRDPSLDDDTQSLNLGSIKWNKEEAQEVNADLVSSVNALAARIFFDFCRDEYWIRQVKQKLQSKLATIHLPYFIENLELSSLDLGTATPHIMSVYRPHVDVWGLWVDFEMKYEGRISLALETKVNLLKLQSGSDEETEERVVKTRPPTHYSDEDLPESPEDSPDEDFGAKQTTKETNRERAGSKIVSLVESAAKSALFQKAAKLPKVAKVITDISSTRLCLNVDVEVIEGTMTVNLPPPPSDRIWYGFRTQPKISLRAVPQVGDRSVDVSAVSEWIENRLKLLLEKNLVCPNMDDVVIPVMSGNELLQSNYNM